jgi:hypothetical protein
MNTDDAMMRAMRDYSTAKARVSNLYKRRKPADATGDY